MTTSVRVSTNQISQDYDVLIEPGAIDRIRALLPDAHTYAIITDTNVARLYAEKIRKQLTNAAVLTFEAGEANKNAETWQKLSDGLINHNAGRDTCIIAVGGGVTGDLAGFVAATYMRGVPVVQVPTTLLAMIDASIGGKTGIDIDGGKNLIGAFHQPHAVIIDPDVLRTLPKHELRYGLAEAIKHGAIADAAYLQWIADSMQSIDALESNAIMHLIQRSVEIKAQFVSADVQEAGARAALNFGHTIAHALERVTRYAMPHGEAVACGMVVEILSAEAAGVTEAGSGAKLVHALEGAALPAALPKGTNSSEVMAAMSTDKKARAGAVRYAIPARLGEFSADTEGNWTRPMPDDVVKGVLARLSIK
jgi:3-dehydroquinate synthase